MSKSAPDARPERWLAALALLAVCVISLGNVVVRYATDASFAFTEEFSVFLLVVLTFAGASLASRRHAHIRIELVEDKLPLRLRPVLYVLQWAASVLLLGLVVWYGGLLAWEEYRWESLSPGLGYPSWIYIVWLPLLCLAIIWRLTQSLLERCRACREEPRHES
ncbi:TRAP transporter small permease [Zobellella endophytica]|uniref:TRAP transporter small permease protein n=1 Tax=Zobellella endophytica TaxID=2116700 RepID=A0A2P7QWL9_9GAMM|nr:TRAP transporter small permease [Zobellella endophytica]PSJ42349.1 TRAP transporter small permease [Zobellella endophytica]